MVTTNTINQSINQSIKSALTDHATQDNHVINWSQPTVIDREPERFTRWIKEAIHIRKEGQQAMNRDEGSYQLSHAYVFTKFRRVTHSGGGKYRWGTNISRFSTNKSLHLANDTRYRHSYYGRRIGARMRSIKWCHFQ